MEDEKEHHGNKFLDDFNSFSTEHAKCEGCNLKPDRQGYFKNTCINSLENNEAKKVQGNSFVEHNRDKGSLDDITADKLDEKSLKKKKKKKKRREKNEDDKIHRNRDSETDKEENEEEIRKRRKHKRKKRKTTESKTGACENGNEKKNKSGKTRKRNSPQFPSDELWLGRELYQNNAVAEDFASNSAVKPEGNSSVQYDLFLASSFSPRSVLQQKRHLAGKYDGAHVQSENCRLPNGDVHGLYKKKENKRTLKKKRLVNLKRTSSKISIWSSELPQISSRLELDPTARTARPKHKPEVGTDTGSENQEEFPEPLKLCKVVTKFPLLSFFAVTLIHTTVIGVTLGLVFSGYDVFPAVFDDLPLYIYNDVRLKELTWRSRTSFDGYIFRPVYGYNINTGYRGSIRDTVEVIYEKPGENILTPAHLFWIKTAEERLFNEINFQEDFCLLDHNYNCVKPQSLVRLFDGTYSNVDSIFYNRNFSNINEVLYKASIYNETKDYLKLFLGKDSVITPAGSYTSITRSFFFMGWPLYKLQNGKWGREEDIKNYLADTFKPKIENIRDFYLVERLDVYYLSKMLYEHDVVEQALKDIMLAIGSVLFIFLFMCFQTGSVVVTSLGVLSILSSFLLTNLVYRYVFQFKYFGFFHVIAIFLILGIGADDLFVFYDTWRLTGHTKYPSNAYRLSDCFRKAAKTTFVTSLTTTIAFLVSGLSPLLPVKTFGIFTGFLVAVNYLWVILYFPSIIIIHHTKTKNIWRRFHRFLLSICLAERLPGLQEDGKTASNADTNSLSETNSARGLLTGSSQDNDTLASSPRKHTLPKSTVLPSISGIPSPSHASTPRLVDNSRDIHPEVTVTLEDGVMNDLGRAPRAGPGSVLSWEKIQSDTAKEEYLMRKRSKPKKSFEERNRIVKFLRNTFFDFMTKRIVKIMIPILFLGVAIFFIHRATMIEPDTHQLRLFRGNHNYAKATDRHYFYFLRNQDDEYQRLYLVWGILPADISACDQKSADFCFGEPKYDRHFEMNTESAQIAFKDLCNRLKNLDAKLADRLHIQRDSINNQLKIACFTEDFEQYFENEVASNWRLPSDMNLSLPVSSDHVTKLMDAYQYIYRVSLPDDFTNYFELLISYWLTDGYDLNPTKDYFRYNELFAERRVQGVTQNAYYSGSGLYYGTKLQYLAIEINTTMNLYSLGYEEGLPVFEEWENFIQSINRKMPAPLKNGIQVTETLWHWLHVQETLASSAITGIIVGLLSAWPILVLTTFNFIIGTIAAVTIGLVTACVIGLIPLAGWKLGVLESINLCMVVGLSVDYIVHLAEAYRMSKSPRRLDRVHDMLESIGLSVISGAITTMGAAVFMLFAKIQFFFQFGIFILSTVGISLVFSLLGFTTLLSLCGPENDTGSVTKMASSLVKFCKKGDNISEKAADEAAKTKSRISCPCASPSILVDRFYDWLSYMKSEHQLATTRQTKPPM
ncbi:uncharacterized protein LOC123533361 [Mercenaria mercenaria]|uniref:uncharacterized protein LOC123533361 n=1 Tax=Mercenaria mercenaria TaxID=6596 RepID=UPI00234F6889|nr:uncharacterized protein LOC123533361 [Mercenaria mercenaria]